MNKLLFKNFSPFYKNLIKINIPFIILFGVLPMKIDLLISNKI